MALARRITECLETETGPAPLICVTDDGVEIRDLDGQVLARIQTIEGGINIAGNAIAAITAFDLPVMTRSIDLTINPAMPPPPFRVLFTRVCDGE